MLVTITLLCLVAAPALGQLTRGLEVKFDDYLSRISITADYALPQSQYGAISAGRQTLHPEGPAQMYSLVMWCPRDGSTVCVFTDDTGYIVGPQTALDANQIRYAIFDSQSLGHSDWTIEVNGIRKNYSPVQKYSISPALIGTYQAPHIAGGRHNSLLHDSGILESGFNVARPSFSVNSNPQNFIGAVHTAGQPARQPDPPFQSSGVSQTGFTGIRPSSSINNIAQDFIGAVQTAGQPARQPDPPFQSSGVSQTGFTGIRPSSSINNIAQDFIGAVHTAGQPARQPDPPLQSSGFSQTGFTGIRPPSSINNNAQDFIGGNVGTAQTTRNPPSRKPDPLLQNNFLLESNFNVARPSSSSNTNVQDKIISSIFGSGPSTRKPDTLQGSSGILNSAQDQPTRIPGLKPDSLLQDNNIFTGINNEFSPPSVANNPRDTVGGKTEATGQTCIAQATAYERGLVARFDDGEDITNIVGRTAYFNLPQSQFEAAAVGWQQTQRPEGPPEMSSLNMWCPRDDHSVCVFIDDTGYIAGTQTALDVDRFENAILDWKMQGFTYWSTQVNGVTKNYWTAQQYYVTPALLAMDAETRIARRKSDTLLQDSAILVSGFNGQLYSISTNACDIISGKTHFTKQACVDKMGIHYAYKISNATLCESDQILPWLSLIHNNQLVGVTLVMYSKHTTPEEGRHWFEILDNALLKVAIPNGPDCLYGLPDKSGLVTLHTYFIKRPYDIKC